VGEYEVQANAPQALLFIDHAHYKSAPSEQSIMVFRTPLD